MCIALIIVAIVSSKDRISSERDIQFLGIPQFPTQSRNQRSTIVRLNVPSPLDTRKYIHGTKYTHNVNFTTQQEREKKCCASDSHFSKMMVGNRFSRVISALEGFAPLSLADRSWDNVGLLVDPSVNNGFRNVLFTIDLTKSVVDEAIQNQCGLIISYHPPVFAPVKRFDAADAKVGPALQCLVAGISVFSPHTALDNCRGGINDWLANAFQTLDVERIDVIQQIESAPVGAGIGRIVFFREAYEERKVIELVKSHLLLDTVRFAGARKNSNLVKSIAICAGSGSSVLKGVRSDMYLTGEMSHHDLLYANAQGISVLLTEHTNSERGFLPQLSRKLFELHPQFDGEFLVSKTDKDPISFV
jgi:dinuclear metal center YbgI/SA1388 family protein